MKSTDFLVIGSGIAGLIYALDVAKYGKVTVLCKSTPNEGNTWYAQGGIASVTSPLDSFSSHIHDTLDAGAGLCHKEVVEMVVTKAPQMIKHLTDLGTKFDREKHSETYELGQEGGHSARRILHSGDHTGAEIQRALYEQAAGHPNITLLPEHIAIDLITLDIKNAEKEVLGAYALDKKTGSISSFAARITMLASGGTGKAYLYTSNPDVATGDGIAMAYRAGAKIGNMEFIQFHPTCLFHPQAKSFLITEAMRGEGAKLKRINGEEFMHLYDPRQELASRDIVARAIDDTLKKTGEDYVLLDISHRDAEFLRNRFPTIYARTKELGFDITAGPIPVVPAAHYCCGGVITDIWGKTSLKRLYCTGESACTGLHGANRLASNSLLEAIVFAQQAAENSKEEFTHYNIPNTIPEWNYLDTIRSPEEVLVSFNWDEVRRLMWNLVGIVRSDKRLASAQRRIEFIKEEVREYYWKYLITADLIELRNIIHVAELIITAAASRRESRGLHYNLDCPSVQDDTWKHDTVIIRGNDGKAKVIR